MRKFSISLAANRFSTNWSTKNVEWTWITKKLQSVKRSFSTNLKEFIQLSSEDQMAIKDQGGYLGGKLCGKRRNKAAIASRSLITLDLDNCNELTPAIPLDCTYIIHSTIKHYTARKRYRIIIPLNRDLSSEEYQFVIRKIAECIGMDFVDHTSFQAERLMFWPVICADSEYEFYENTGKLLDPNDYLVENWTDKTCWPTHPAENKSEVERTKGDMQLDPRGKGGIIGAFCRAYYISRVCSEVLDCFELVKENIYTYRGGSSAGGAKVYGDDRFMYSYHQTDPGCEQMLNSFDLVRIHKFNGDMKACISWCKSLPEIVGLVNTEISCDEESCEDWVKKLGIDNKGARTDSMTNLETIMNNVWNLRYNEYGDIMSITVDGKERPINDMDFYTIQADIEKYYGIRSVAARINTAIYSTANANSYHPVKEYLESLVWDGVERAESLIIDAFGAEDSILNRAMTRKTLAAAVRRIYNPGCKFDYMLTLVGPRGYLKSSLFKKLGAEWFADSLKISDMKDDRGYGKIENVWIMECPELTGMRKSDVEVVKSFLSSSSDKYRKAWGRVQRNIPRSGILVGTTNSIDGFLIDPSGGRNFWPIVCNKKWDKKLETDQIWAEVMERWGEESIYLDNELERLVGELQNDMIETDDRIDEVRYFLEKSFPETWYEKERTTTPIENLKDGGVLKRETFIQEIWRDALRKDIGTIDMRNTKEIALMLRKLGYEKGGEKRIKGFGRIKEWYRI